MGATKTEHFTDKQNDISSIAKALGHPARLAIMEYLIKVDTLEIDNYIELVFIDVCG